LGVEETKLDPALNAADDHPDDQADTGAPVEDDTDPKEPDARAPIKPRPDGGVTDVDSGGGAEPMPPKPGKDFTCLGAEWLTRSDDTTLEIVATISDIATGDPVVGLKLTECKTRLDLSCTGVQVLSDDKGVARVPVRRGFNGYLKVEGPDTKGTEYVGYLWYFSQPLYNTYSFPILAMERTFRDGFFYSGLTRNPKRGEIAVQVTDCTAETDTSDVDGEPILKAPGVPAAGIRLSISNPSFLDKDSREFYFSNGLPVSPPTATSTDASGLGGFLNVKAGPVPLTATPEGSKKVISSDTLLVIEDFLTTVRLLPE
jgi:hypothetical protein